MVQEGVNRLHSQEFQQTPYLLSLYFRLKMFVKKKQGSKFDQRAVHENRFLFCTILQKVMQWHCEALGMFDLLIRSIYICRKS